MAIASFAFSSDADNCNYLHLIILRLLSLTSGNRTGSGIIGVLSGAGADGRSINEKCSACSLLMAGEARKLHDETLGGTGCWQDEVYHSRRSYYRKGRSRGGRRSPQVEEIVVPIPEVPFVVLHTYVDKPRQANDEVVIHAMCVELWMGGKPIALTQPQHTFGLPPRTVKEYARQLRPCTSGTAVGDGVGLSGSPARSSIWRRSAQCDRVLTMQIIYN